VLLAHEVPESGGDTVFASMYAAYEALADGHRATLRSLRAVHSSRHVFGFKGRTKETDDLATRIGNPELVTQDAVHPVVITHPESGRSRIGLRPGPPPSRNRPRAPQSCGNGRPVELARRGGCLEADLGCLIAQGADQHRHRGRIGRVRKRHHRHAAGSTLAMSPAV
jgi:hypothetical protein